MQKTALFRQLPRNLTSLQAGRGIAAILVVLFHTSRAIFQNPKYWQAVPLGGVFDFGASGVTFFFVLSGFIIYHAHLPDLNRPDRLQGYLWKRFRRIYPIYWVLLLLVLPIYFVARNFGFGYETHPDVILSSVLLVHLRTPYQVIDVSWTLFHEILFYALFAVMIWRARVGLVVLGLWFAASTQTIDPATSGRLLPFYFSYLHLLFGFGIAARMFLQRRAVPRPIAILLLGVAVILLIGADQDYWHRLSGVWQTLVFGLGSTLALLGAVELQAQGRLRVPGWLTLLGDASYAIYLVHFLALSVLAKLAWSSGLAKHLPIPVAFVLMAGLATAAGLALHLLVERPLLTRLGRRAPAAQPTRARAA